MKRVSLALLCSSLLTATAAQALECNWQPVESQDGVQVSTCEIAGSPLKAFRGTTTVKADVAQIVSLFKDTANHPNWMHHIASAKLVKANAENDYYTYTVQDLPFPISDRDNVTHTVMSVDAKGALVLNIEAAPGVLPPTEGLVRMSAFKATWTFQPKGNGDLAVTYEAHANPGGSLPTALTNKVVVETPLNTLSNLRKQNLAKYSGKSYAFITGRK